MIVTREFIPEFSMHILRLEADDEVVELIVKAQGKSNIGLLAISALHDLLCGVDDVEIKKRSKV